MAENVQLLPEEDDINLEGDSNKGLVNSGPSAWPSLLGVFSLVFPGEVSCGSPADAS